jgi:hypothetical protein
MADYKIANQFSDLVDGLDAAQIKARKNNKIDLLF